MRNRKLVLSGAALLATGAIVVPAIAQSGSTTIEITKVQVSPNKAGTVKKPQAVRLSVAGKLTTPASEPRPIVYHARLLFPKGSLWNGAKHPACTLTKLQNGEIPSDCKKAIAGTGSAKGYADTEPTTAKITLLNGGAKTAFAFIEMNIPAVVREPAVAKIKKTSGKWAYQVDIDIPETVQVVASTPIAITELALSGGKGDLLATTSCPKTKKWPFVIEVDYKDPITRQPKGTAKIESSTSCR